MTLEEAALRAARAGLYVFPVRGKVPTVARGVHAASNVETRVRSMFRTVSCDGLAIACGHPLRSGGTLMVLDVDPPGGTDTLAGLEAEFGTLPVTRTHRTPRGGTHHLFRSPEPMPCKVGFQPNLDIRGKGGFVVSPPSPGYRVETLAPVADAPEWLLEMIRPKPRPTHETGDESPQVSCEITDWYVDVVLRREVAAVETAPEGTRNATLNRAAFALARFVADGKASAYDITRCLAAAATRAGLGEVEIERTIRSAFRAREVRL